MKKFSKGHHSSLNELNITPLLDLAFVLLVIFIITTPQLSNDLEMSLPSAKKPPPQTPPPRINYIDVDLQGRVKLNNQPTDLPTLKQTLVAMEKADTNTSVVVRGAAEVDYQNVVSVVDIIQQAEITKMGMATAAVQ